MTGNIGDTLYPVGSIYMNINLINPAEYFGGVWERIQDTFLLAASSSYAAGSTGGDAQHTMTVAEMPTHQHSLLGGSHSFFWGTNVGNVSARNAIATGNAATGNCLYTQQNEWTKVTGTGSGQAFSIMPPYLSVYMWKRIA